MKIENKKGLVIEFLTIVVLIALIFITLNLLNIKLSWIYNTLITCGIIFGVDICHYIILNRK